MLFNTPAFLVFFLVFYVVFHLLLKGNDAKLILICTGSLFFYGTWNIRFVPILLGTGLVDFYLARMIAREEVPLRKRNLLTLSVVMNLSVLAFFKYTDFALASLHDGLALVGVKTTARSLGLVAPLGISFYTFQSLSYTLDVYRGVYKPQKRFLEFLSSLTFFPHLVAGPIVRSSMLLPQFEKLPPLTDEAGRRGLLLVASGLFKKTIADLLGQTVAATFDKAGALHGVAGWTGALAFTAQIYGDFAGYTDMAMGVAALLGIRLPDNFNLPYLATSPVDFWRRWHITLSNWLRDYLYMPLALAIRQHPYFNLILTMTLAGLWHGPRWTYVAFGLYHGVLLAITQWLISRTSDEWNDRLSRWPLKLPRIALTFYLTVVGFVVFRAETFAGARRVLRAMHGVPRGASSADLFSLGLVGAALAACHLLDGAMLYRAARLASGWRFWALAVLCFACAIALSEPGSPFIYFQF
jgi:D-alanyl-lipoteichoic acid acyltransferase DltB (MBOAT superfamily)